MSQRIQVLRHINFHPASHMDVHQSQSSQPAPTWQELSVMTPRQIAVEQLLSHKLHASSSQQDPLRAQSAQAQGPVTPQSPRGVAPVASVTTPHDLQTSSSSFKVPAQIPYSCMQSEPRCAQLWLCAFTTKMLQGDSYVHSNPVCCTALAMCLQD